MITDKEFLAAVGNWINQPVDMVLRMETRLIGAAIYYEIVLLYQNVKIGITLDTRHLAEPGYQNHIARRLIAMWAEERYIFQSPPRKLMQNGIG